MQEPDHHAMSALRENASAGASQGGGGQAGTPADQDHGTQMFGSSAMSNMESKGFAHENVTGKGGDLNNNLMASLNAGGEKLGGKINAFEGMQHAEMNAAAGKNLTSQVIPNLKLAGKAQEQGASR